VLLQPLLLHLYRIDQVLLRLQGTAPGAGGGGGGEILGISNRTAQKGSFMSKWQWKRAVSISGFPKHIAFEATSPFKHKCLANVPVRRVPGT
jgi:hypothetical protein